MLLLRTIGGRQLSYRELDERAESLAGLLRNHGVQGRFVGRYLS